MGAIVYSPEYVYRVLRSRESSVDDYLRNFPLSRLSASARPHLFEADLDEEAVTVAFEAALDVDDLDGFMEATETQALVVLVDGVIRFERYYNETTRDSMLTSFSVAKSFDSALVGSKPSTRSPTSCEGVSNAGDRDGRQAGSGSDVARRRATKTSRPARIRLRKMLVNSPRTAW